MAHEEAEIERYLKHAEWIEWEDTWGVSTWQPISRRRTDTEPTRCYSVGYVLNETDESVVLAMSIDTLGNCDHSLTIPKNVILKRYTIR